MTARTLDNKRKRILIDEHQSGLEGNYLMYTYYFEILQSIFIDFHGKIFFKNSLEKRLLFMNIKLFKQFVNNC